MIPLSRIPRGNLAPVFRRWKIGYGTRPYSDLASSNDRFESHEQENFTRRSRYWTPGSRGIQASPNETSHEKLIRAGFLRQSISGVYHMLPLGQRVEEKLQKLIDKHMSQVGASKLSLSSISPQSLWRKTSRLDAYGQELFRFHDRKKTPLLLAPTHEEEITTLVSNLSCSYKELPLRLYQIGRKYRDEFRPRAGLLRSKEFLMKDLYTFDYSIKAALSTYEEVKAVYTRFFGELKLRIKCAEASSGDIGGDKSHEFHLGSPNGEDLVFSCNSCDYAANDEVASSRPDPPINEPQSAYSDNWDGVGVWRGISKDKDTLVNVWYPNDIGKEGEGGGKGDPSSYINTQAIKAVFPELDLSLDDVSPFWSLNPPHSTNQRRDLRIMNIVDYRLGASFIDAFQAKVNSQSPGLILPEDSDIKLSDITNDFITSAENETPLNTIRIRSGDNCPRCESGKLEVERAIELGHIFYLGTKYSEALKASVEVPTSLLQDEVELAKVAKPTTGDRMNVYYQMGCHGIGVSRMVAAVAESMHDELGLNWPRAIAPFEVVVIPHPTLVEDGTLITQHLANSQGHESFDLMLDDRDASLPFKLKDAELVGYPVAVVVGKKWTSERLVEVQCRSPARHKEYVQLEDLRAHISELLSQR
ncbi:prolyl-tRNA synthetase [Rostrohypoxylon terebratum]|nr:prolyl-tRNA synthetase [Rostrohypoxylon terebratum]